MSSVEHYDVVVVGSGPGGATVARELNKQNKRVLLLEWGSNAPVSGNMFNFFLNAGLPFKSLLFTNLKFLTMVRGICTGGSSIFYCATAFDPPYDLLRKYGIDLEQEVAELKAEIPMAPASDAIMGPGAKRIMESAQDLGYNWNRLNKFIYQDKCIADCWKCSYGCPYGAKWTARNFVEEAVEGGVNLVNGAKVTRVLFEGDTAVGVEYKKNFMTHTVTADKVILAAGGVGTPKILRHSGIYGAGYDFFFDPLIMVFGAVKDVKGKGEIQMAAGAHMDDGYLMVDLDFPLPVYLAQTIPKGRVDRAMAYSNNLMIMIKIKDDLGGRMTWQGGIRKSLSKEDKLKFKKGCGQAKDILKNAGAKGIFTGWTLAAHPGGTAKVNDIVDSNLKTVKNNLYVCDCSVIPEGWGLPPTLTLLALGKRLAKHLSA